MRSLFTNMAVSACARVAAAAHLSRALSALAIHLHKAHLLTSFRGRWNLNMIVSTEGYVQYCRERGIRINGPATPTQQQSLGLALALTGLLLHPQTVDLLLRYFGGSRQRRAGTSQGISEMLITLQRLQENAAEQDGKRSPLAAKIRQEIPDLTGRINAILSDPPFRPFAEDDAKAVALVEWFKLDYMRWVDPIKCAICSGSTRPVGSANPTADERKGNASRVELHHCTSQLNHPVRRFPRYNDLMTLVRTREGRCGEFAHVFCFFLGAYGLDARYVWNSEDHVWTEYWSKSLERWVHIDSCEAATNKALLYATGWGKKQAFCIATGPEGLQDVTRAYVDDWSGACQDRRRARGWSEQELAESIRERTRTLRSSLTDEEKREAAKRERFHQAWLEDDERRASEAREQELGGRESGPEEWREARQEMGGEMVDVPYTVDRIVFDSIVNEPKLFGHISTMGVAPGFPVELTSGPSQTSAMFSEVSIPQSKNFRASMTFRIDAAGGGADGLALVFTSDRRLGLGGYGMGYSGLGQNGDFAVEVDTYRTEDHASDPPTPHISIHSPPNAHHRYSLACAKAHQLPRLTDGKTHDLTLLFDAEKRRLRVKLNDSGLLESSVPAGLESDWFMGVTAACGGLYQLVEIIQWSLAEITYKASSEPDV